MSWLVNTKPVPRLRRHAVDDRAALRVAPPLEREQVDVENLGHDSSLGGRPRRVATVMRVYISGRR